MWIPDPENAQRSLSQPGEDLHGAAIIVTGAGSGIGRRVTKRLLEMNAKVTAVDVRQDRLRDLTQASPNNEVLIMESALNKSDEAEVVVEATARRFGQVDGLVSCAGGSYTGLLTEITDEAWAQCINQNLSTQFFILKAVLENAKRASQGCSVVLIGSKTAVAPGLGFGAYAIAKAGVVQLGRIAALEGGKFGVRVNTVNPGAIFEGSQFWSPELVHERARLNGVPPETLEHHYSSRNALQRRVTTRDVAETVIFLLSQRSSATTGCILTVDGGDEHAFPR